MSALEAKVKPLILTILEGRETKLTSDSVNTLARWVTVKSIVGEYAVEGTALTPEVDRRVLYEEQRLPDYFRVFAALHSLSAQAAYYRHSTTVSLSGSGPTPSLPSGIRRNIQATTFFVGRLCFFVSAVRVDGLSASILDPSFQMQRLWPNAQETVDLASTPPLGEIHVYSISRVLERLVQHPLVKYGGPLPQGS